MKKRILLLVGIFLGISSFAQTEISVDPASQSIGLNEVFTTTVEIDDVLNLGGFELSVNFDPALIQANSITIGDFLGSTGRQVFPLTNIIDNTNGLASFAATTLGAAPVGPDGNGTLLTIQWNSTSVLNVETATELVLTAVQITKPNGDLIEHLINNGTVTIIPCSDPPVAICQDISIELDQNGEANITAAHVDNGSSAPCGLANMTVTPHSFGCEDNGVNQVTLTVIDDYGNTSTCISNVTVLDNNSPIISISPSSQEVFVASSFTTQVEVTNVSNLGAFELEMNYDASLIQANSVTLDDFLGSSGREIFPILNEIDNNIGLIEFAVATLGPNPPGPDGDGVLLTIEWSTSEELNEETLADIIIQNVQLATPDGTVMCKSIENASVSILLCYPHDFDCDCDVDIIDVTMAAYTYGTAEGDIDYDPRFDLDSDGDIDIIDITMVTFDYGWTCDDGKKSAINLNVDNSNVELGFAQTTLSTNTYESYLYIENIEQLSAYELSLNYDPHKIKVLQISSGEILEEGKNKVLLLDKNISESGHIHYAVASMGFENSDMSKSGVLLNIKYQSKEKINEPFKIEYAQLARTDAEIIPFKVKDLQMAETVNNNIISTFPSPFIQEMTIQYQVASNAYAYFKVFDTEGKLVRETTQKSLKKGVDQITFTRDSLGKGTYVIALIVDGRIVDSKHIVVQ